jgi:Tfp pilus assembly protein PilX
MTTMNSASTPSTRRFRRTGETGVVLFTALVLLLILTLVGVLLARSESVEETISENDQDHQLAVQAAEATLRFAEACLYNQPAYLTCQTQPFTGDSGGWYTWQSGAADAYQANNPFAPTSSPAAQFLPYGGPALPVAGTPEFLIESMPAVTLPGNALGGGGYGAPTPTSLSVYRITAYSYGGDTSATAELQEIDLQ